MKMGSPGQVKEGFKSKPVCGRVRELRGCSLHLAHSLPWTEKMQLLGSALENTYDKQNCFALPCILVVLQSGWMCWPWDVLHGHL